jgi:sialidase-1
MNPWIFLLLFSYFFWNSPHNPTPAADALTETVLFAGDSDGYHTYRIPSIIVTPQGTVLAFAEGRKDNSSDTGDIDLLLKRSLDGGKTWQKQQVIWDDGSHVCGNPTPVVDEETGTIWLLMTWNRGDDHETDIIKKASKDTRRVFVSSSNDEGETWTSPKDITPTTKDPSWGWYATGPGVGIQIKHGPHKGRLVIPSDHSYDDPDGKIGGGPYEYGSHSIYSDDHGETWQLGGTIRPKANECQAVELADGKGTLLMNMRAYFGRNLRTHAWSSDGGTTWTDPQDAEDLLEPVCQSSLVRHSWPKEGQKSRILFANPASTKRVNMTVKLSEDEGQTWPVAKTLYPGPSAYSSLAVLPNGEILCLYENGEDNPYEKITLARFTLDWLISQD